MSEESQKMKIECQCCKHGQIRDGYMFCSNHNVFRDFWSYCWEFEKSDI